jgi:hypothetical protein
MSVGPITDCRCRPKRFWRWCGTSRRVVAPSWYRLLFFLFFCVLSSDSMLMVVCYDRLDDRSLFIVSSHSQQPLQLNSSCCCCCRLGRHRAHRHVHYSSQHNDAISRAAASRSRSALLATADQRRAQRVGTASSGVLFRCCCCCWCCSLIVCGLLTFSNRLR